MLKTNQTGLGYGVVILGATSGLLLLWPGLLENLLAVGGFMPHGHCYLWKPALVSLHVASDTLIGLAYVSISTTLAYLVYKARQDIPFHWMLLAFGLFIVACGGTHFMEVWTLWTPVYWLAGEIKLITAIASVTTALLLPPLIPKVLALVTAAKASEERKVHLETANQELEVLNERLKNLDELKTQFFANVSHELRTPLALILGPTEKLLTATEFTEEQQHNLKVVQRNANILLKRVNDLLDVSKLEAGKVKVNYANVDLTQLIRLTAAHFEALAQERHITLSVQTPSQVLAQVDPEKIQRVCLNLLSNAFKFTPDFGQISISLQISGTASELEPTPFKQAIILVQDSGLGVPPEQQKTIFERFHQGESGLTRRFGGTGLGLAIVKEFVELHQGSVAVSNAPGSGALFTVELPLMAAPGAVVQTVATNFNTPVELTAQVIAELSPVFVTETPTQVPNQPLVLVIEDNLEMNRFITGALATQYRTAVAFDGEEGLAKAIALQPDLILSDVMMPKMSGDQLLQAIRANETLDTVPIVFLTAKADDELRVRLLRQGAQDYLMKPFSTEEIMIRVGNLIAMKQTRQVLQQELASQSQNIAVLANEAALQKRELHKAYHLLEAVMAERAQAERMQLLQEQMARKVAESAQRRSAFLAAASQVLTASLNYEATLSGLAALVIENLADFCLVDLATKDGRIRRIETIHTNPAKTAILQELQRQYPPNSAQTCRVLEVLRTGKAELISDILDWQLQAAAQDEQHLQLLRELRPKSVMLVPLLAHGRSLGVITLAITESERRFDPEDLTLAEELAHHTALAVENSRLYQEAQEASQMKDEFLAIVSHELRTPLNAMLGWSQMLQTRKFDAITTARALETIERNAKLQTQLIDDILDVSRIIRGKLRLNTYPINPNTAIEAALQAIRPLAEAKNIQLLSSSKALNCQIMGDPDRLQQIIWNLLSNAVKFTSEQGRVEVSLSVVRDHSSFAASGRLTTDSPEPSTQYVQIQVRDDGIGISPDFLPYVFEHFRQADSSTTRSHGGLGLGLAIVRHLVELQGGRVAAASQGEGQGTTFTVLFPLWEEQKQLKMSLAADQRQPSAEFNQATPAHIESVVSTTIPMLPTLTEQQIALLKGLQVLVVDDEADTRELLATVLEQCEVHVATAASTQEALSALQQLKLDVLISDIGMPEADGYMLISQIREQEKQLQTLQVPAIALTAYAREEDRKKALAAGFQMHVSKPIEPAELTRAICSLVGKTKTSAISD